jgi:hypothetical protein
MGLLDLLKLFKKKKKTPKKGTYNLRIDFGKPDDSTVDMNHLDKDGELPWGWYTHNKAFTDRINNEYSHFLNMWIYSKQQAPKKQYEALKSFVLYLEDVEKLCKSKGECFEFWFYNILTSKDYIKQRKDELKHLTANLDELQEIYEKTPQIKPTIELLIKENDGILQSELKKMFDDVYQEAVSDALHELYKEGKFEKIKSGRSYTLHYRG